MGTIRIFRWLGEIVRVLPRHTGPILAFSVVANLLLLVSPFYMLQVYDRILTSGSIDTLIWLTVISVFLLGIYAAAEIGRRRLCTLAAEAIDERMARNAFADFASEPAAGARLPSTLRRMARIQGYFANQAILPFFDLPFAPFFLAVMFVIHPLIGLIGVSGAGLMLVLAVVAEATTRGMHDKASALDSDAFELALGLGDQRSAIVSMGLTGRALAAWQQKKALAPESVPRITAWSYQSTACAKGETSFASGRVAHSRRVPSDRFVQTSTAAHATAPRCAQRGPAGLGHSIAVPRCS